MICWSRWCLMMKNHSFSFFVGHFCLTSNYRPLIFWELAATYADGERWQHRQKTAEQERKRTTERNRWSICVSIILLHLGPARLVYCTSNATPRPSYHFSSSLNSNKYRNTMSLSPRTDSTTRRSTPRTFYQFSQLHEELVINVLSYLADVPYKYSSKGEIEVICGK